MDTANDVTAAASRRKAKPSRSRLEWKSNIRAAGASAMVDDDDGDFTAQPLASADEPVDPVQRAEHAEQDNAAPAVLQPSSRMVCRAHAHCPRSAWLVQLRKRAHDAGPVQHEPVNSGQPRQRSKRQRTEHKSVSGPAVAAEPEAALHVPLALPPPAPSYPGAAQIADASRSMRLPVLRRDCCLVTRCSRRLAEHRGCARPGQRDAAICGTAPAP